MAQGPHSPLTVPWKMKALSSAETQVERLADGRRRYSIRHEVISGVTPAMLVWWLNNMEGMCKIGDQEIPRYRAWHPRDHVALTYVRPGLDGRRFSQGAQIRIQEFFSANLNYKIDVIDEVGFLDETGFSHRNVVAGVELASMDYSFKEVSGGTLYENALTVGIHKPAFLAALNAPIQALKFPEEMGRAWLTHNVEEVGNLQFFLPDLYRAERRV